MVRKSIRFISNMYTENVANIDETTLLTIKETTKWIAKVIILNTYKYFRNRLPLLFKLNLALNLSKNEPL